MSTGVLVLLTLVVQRLMAHPALPEIAGELWLPVVWLVWPPLRQDRNWPLWALVVLGLCWDVLMEPVIGPGGISWSAAGLAVGWAARRIAGRSPAAWAGAGALAAAMVLSTRWLSLLPLGLHLPIAWPAAGRVVLMAALLCAAVGTVARVDVAEARRRFRRRRLR